MSSGVRSLRKHRRFDIGQGALVLTCLAVLFLSLYRLQSYPRIGFDEGSLLQVPKNLVLYGEYAMRSSEGFRVLDPALTTGPTVLLSLALSFKLFGIGLLQARLVMAIFLLAAIWAFHQVAVRLFGRGTALIAVWLLMTLPYPSMINIFYLGRLVMGNAAAFFFFLSFVLIWIKAVDSPGRGVVLHILAGMLMGLAMITKLQYLLLLPVMALVWLADRLYYKKLHWHDFIPVVVTSLACLAVWYVGQMAILGPDEFVTRIGATRSVTTTSVLVFSLPRALANAKELAGSAFLFVGVPSLIYGIALCTPRESDSIKRLLLLTFAGAWICWYVFASAGWEHYSFDFLMVTCIFVGKLCADLTRGSWGSLRTIWAALKARRPFAVSPNIGVSLILLFVVIFSCQRAVKTLVTADDGTQREFARLLDSSIGTDAVIETWEWELAFLTGHNYHFPPTDVTTAMAGEMFLDRPYPRDLYDFRKHHPDYLVAGHFSKLTGLYSEAFLRDNCVLIETVGEYDLYGVQNGSLD